MVTINKTVTGNAINFAADAASSFITTTGDLTLESTPGSILLRGGEAVVNAVQITAFNVAGGIDIDAGATSGIIDIDAGGAISIDAGGASNFTTSSGALTLSGVSLAVLATGGVADFDATGAISINSSGGVINLGNDAIAQNINIGSAGDRDVFIGNTTSNTSFTLGVGGTGGIFLGASGSGTGAIDIGTSSSARTIAIGNAASTLATVDAIGISLDALTTNSNFSTTTGTLTLASTGNTSESAVIISAGAGGVNIDAAATKDVDISGGQVLISSKTTGGSAIALTTNQGTAETIVITNTQGNGSGAITLLSSAGGVDIDAGTTVDIDSTGILTIDAAGTSTIGFGSVAGTGNLSIGTFGAARLVTIGSTTTSATTTIRGGTGGISVNPTTSGALTLGTTHTGTINLGSATAGAVTINSNGVINIGNDAATDDMNIGTGTSARIITMGNGNGSTSIDIQNGSGAANFAANATVHTTTIGSLTGASTTIVRSGTGNLDLTSTGTGSDAIHLNANAAAGGIQLEAGTSGVIIVDSDVGGLIFDDSTSAFNVILQASPTLSESYTIAWPVDSGTANQVLTTDGTTDSQLTWTTPAGGGGSGIKTWEASDFLNSTETGWSVTVLAPTIADPTLNMVHVRAFDGSTDEAVGMQYFIDSGATNLDFTLIWRKSSSVAGTVIWDIHARQFISGSVITADSWDSTGTEISSNDPGSNQNIVKSTASISLTNLSITADQLAYMQLVRDASADGYNADCYVLSLSIVTS